MVISGLVLLAFLQLNSPTCILKEGVGSDFATIGVTKRSEARLVPPHVHLVVGDDDVVSEIIALRGNCRTSKNMRVGDSEENVVKVYGKGTKRIMEIKKGTSVIRYGDYVLEYPGVEFAINQGKVILIVVKAAH